MSTKKTDTKNQFLMYKGKPLVRNKDTIYYGDLNEKHVIVMQILSSEPLQDLTMATNVLVQLVLTDESVKLKNRIVKKIEKPGIYPAMDVGAIWLERANAPAKSL